MDVIHSTSKWQRIIGKIGTALIAVSLFIITFTYYPIVKEEVKYWFVQSKNPLPVMTREELTKAGENSPQALMPVDENFGIVIPKISANAKVIPNVDWQDSAAYQRALTMGVAQAKGTALPGELGNSFIFAHSGVDFFEALRYNAVFYLIDKLQNGDEIDLFYQHKKYQYQVTEKKIVGADELRYMIGDASQKTVTLMTCWPPGTTLQRLVVIGTLQSI